MTEASDRSPVRWYVIQCKPRQDRRALAHLECQGFACYLPTRHITRIRAGRKVEVRESLFPGYLFARLDSRKDNWGPIRSTRGVDQIVRFGEHPTPVPDEIIEQIRARLASAPAENDCLKPGERVQITGGVFSQVEAIFVADDGDDRVVLLMNILQREQTVSFPLRNVRKWAT